MCFTLHGAPCWMNRENTHLLLPPSRRANVLRFLTSGQRFPVVSKRIRDHLSDIHVVESPRKALPRILRQREIFKGMSHLNLTLLDIHCDSM